jgi:hypothetical protein
MKGVDSMYYVTMTDKLMSGWGMADRKINKLIFVCESFDEAEIVAGNAGYRADEMKHINITRRKPYYNPRRYYPQVKTKDDYPSWYIKDYFK